jgi:uncharacterized protein (TIGR01777 family)
MKVILAGGSGFLGRPLSAALADGGHEVVVLTRGQSAGGTPGRPVNWQPDGTADARWAGEVDGADAVVNLAGASIAGSRWTQARKLVLRDSRLLSTRSLVAAMRAATRKPPVFISASAVGYYGATGDEPIDESSAPGNDFLGRLGVDWESEARAAEALGCRVVLFRSGIVLAADGGALEKLIPPFRLFAGGPIASGRQYMSWIHRDDWIRLIQFVLDHPQMTGAVNATAPQPVTNEAFSKALGRALDRPSWLRVPRLALRLLVGEMADAALVKGQRAFPRRALEAGFTFEHAEIEEALAAATGGSR